MSCVRAPSLFTDDSPQMSERDAKIVKMHHQGVSARQICERFGLGKTTALRVLHRLGLIPNGNAPVKATDDHIKAIGDLWSAGASASAIGTALGVTKNAVIGIVHRYGLKRSEAINVRNRRSAGLERSERQPRKPKAERPTEKAPKMAAPKLAYERVFVCTEADLAKAKTLADLDINECRFPLNDPAPGMGETTLFCAEPTHRTYCRKHARVAYAPTPPAKDLIRSLRRFA
jgi:hypothetical protein